MPGSFQSNIVYASVYTCFLVTRHCLAQHLVSSKYSLAPLVSITNARLFLTVHLTTHASSSHSVPSHRGLRVLRKYANDGKPSNHRQASDISIIKSCGYIKVLTTSQIVVSTLCRLSPVAINLTWSNYRHAAVPGDVAHFLGGETVG